MELSYKELRKREVINVSDGQSFGRIVDLTLDFPKGVLVGISVPARRRSGLFSLFDRSTFYIDESKILKIGSDVILVDINCKNACMPNVNVNARQDKKPPVPPPPCVPPCVPPCAPQRPAKGHDGNFEGGKIFDARFDSDGDEY